MVTEGIFTPTVEMMRKFWMGLSTLILALIVFFLGWLVAKLIAPLFTRFFRAIKVDKLIEDSGFKTLLVKGNITRPVSELLGTAIYWVLLLVVVFIALTVGNVSIPSSVIGQLLEFIPKFVLGIVVFIFSVFLGKIFKGVVITSASNAGVENPGFLAKVTEIGIIIFGTVLTLQIIGIAATFIGNVFNIILAAFCFGTALAFALGSKDLIKEWLESIVFFQKFKKRE